MAIDFQEPEAGDAVDLGAPSSLANIWDGGGTAMAWINARDFGAAGEGSIFWTDGGWLLILFSARASPHFLVVFSGGNFRWEMPNGQMTGNFNEWHHVAVTYDGDSASNDPIYYFDGALVSTVEIETGSGSIIDDSAMDKTIGNLPNTPQNRQFNGRLADARMYDRILSANEIATIYALKGKDGIRNELVGRWAMDEGPPGTAATGADSVRDQSPFGNHGTPADSPLYATDELSPRRRMR